MKILKITAVLISLLFLNSCASGYKIINPAGLSYNSQNQEQDVTMEYKYDLLHKKYAKKEEKKDIRLVAVKITNHSERDLIFGQDVNIAYESGGQLLVMPTDKVFKGLKQHPTTYLPYLLLSPLTLSTFKTDAYGNQHTTGTFPAGLIVGPGLAGGHLIAASSANKNFKNELRTNELQGRTIPKGETVYGLIGIRADSYDALKIQLEETENDPDPALITP